MAKEMIVWECEKCKMVWSDKELADKCCDENVVNNCRVCGCEVKKHFSICTECWNNERYEKAKKVKYSEYNVGCIYDGHRDEYFRDLEELEETYYTEAFFDGKEPEYPTWCYGCVEIPFQIDIDSVIEQEAEEMYDDFDAEKELVDLDELISFIDEWNKKQTAKSYEVDFQTVVLLNE